MTTTSRLALALVLLLTLTLAGAARAAPPSWAKTLASAETVSTFPKAYALDLGHAQSAVVHLKATCSCGAQTVTIKIQGSLDGSTWFDQALEEMDGTQTTGYTLTTTGALDEFVRIGMTDAASAYHDRVDFPIYQVSMTKDAGSPSLTGVTIQFFAPGRTR